MWWALLTAVAYNLNLPPADEWVLSDTTVAEWADPDCNQDNATLNNDELTAALLTVAGDVAQCPQLRGNGSDDRWRVRRVVMSVDELSPSFAGFASRPTATSCAPGYYCPPNPCTFLEMDYQNFAFVHEGVAIGATSCGPVFGRGVSGRMAGKPDGPLPLDEQDRVFYPGAVRGERITSGRPELSAAFDDLHPQYEERLVATYAPIDGEGADTGQHDYTVRGDTHAMGAPAGFSNNVFCQLGSCQGAIDSVNGGNVETAIEKCANSLAANFSTFGEVEIVPATESTEGGFVCHRCPDCVLTVLRANSSTAANRRLTLVRADDLKLARNAKKSNNLPITRAGSDDDRMSPICLNGVVWHLAAYFGTTDKAAITATCEAYGYEKDFWTCACYDMQMNASRYDEAVVPDCCEWKRVNWVQGYGPGWRYNLADLQSKAFVGQTGLPGLAPRDNVFVLLPPAATLTPCCKWSFPPDDGIPHNPRCLMNATEFDLFYPNYDFSPCLRTLKLPPHASERFAPSPGADFTSSQIYVPQTADRQNCTIDGVVIRWYSCNDARCSGYQLCPNNQGLQQCACPAATEIQPGFIDLDGPSVQIPESGLKVVAAINFGASPAQAVVVVLAEEGDNATAGFNLAAGEDSLRTWTMHAGGVSALDPCVLEASKTEYALETTPWANADATTPAVFRARLVLNQPGFNPGPCQIRSVQMTPTTAAKMNYADKGVQPMTEQELQTTPRGGAESERRRAATLGVYDAQSGGGDIAQYAMQTDIADVSRAGKWCRLTKDAVPLPKPALTDCEGIVFTVPPPDCQPQCQFRKVKMRLKKIPGGTKIETLDASCADDTFTGARGQKLDLDSCNDVDPQLRFMADDGMPLATIGKEAAKACGYLYTVDPDQPGVGLNKRTCAKFSRAPDSSLFVGKEFVLDDTTRRITIMDNSTYTLWGVTFMGGEEWHWGQLRFKTLGDAVRHPGASQVPSSRNAHYVSGCGRATAGGGSLQGEIVPSLFTKCCEVTQPKPHSRGVAQLQQEPKPECPNKDEQFCDVGGWNVRWYCPSNPLCNEVYECETNPGLKYDACPPIMAPNAPQSRAHAAGAHTWVNYFDGLKSAMHPHAQCGRVPDALAAGDRTDDIGLANFYAQTLEVQDDFQIAHEATIDCMRNLRAQSALMPAFDRNIDTFQPLSELPPPYLRIYDNYQRGKLYAVTPQIKSATDSNRGPQQLAVTGVLFNLASSHVDADELGTNLRGPPIVQYGVDHSSVFVPADYPGRPYAINSPNEPVPPACDCSWKEPKFECLSLTHNEAAVLGLACSDQTPGTQCTVCSWSWSGGANGVPPVGLYVPSRAEIVPVIERDPLGDPDTADADAERFFFGPGSPHLADLEELIASVGHTGKTKASDFVSPTDGKPVSSDNRAWSTRKTDVYTLPGTCVRAPYGRLHRAVLSPADRARYWGAVNITTASLYGYCEKVAGMFIHCDNDPKHRDERDNWCSQHPSAAFTTSAIHINRDSPRTADQACAESGGVMTCVYFRGVTGSGVDSLQQIVNVAPTTMPLRVVIAPFSWRVALALAHSPYRCSIGHDRSCGVSPQMQSRCHFFAALSASLHVSECPGVDIADSLAAAGQGYAGQCDGGKVPGPYDIYETADVERREGYSCYPEVDFQSALGERGTVLWRPLTLVAAGGGQIVVPAGPTRTQDCAALVVRSPGVVVQSPIYVDHTGCAPDDPHLRAGVRFTGSSAAGSSVHVVGGAQTYVGATVVGFNPMEQAFSKTVLDVTGLNLTIEGVALSGYAAAVTRASGGGAVGCTEPCKVLLQEGGDGEAGEWALRQATWENATAWTRRLGFAEARIAKARYARHEATSVIWAAAITAVLAAAVAWALSS